MGGTPLPRPEFQERNFSSTEIDRSAVRSTAMDCGDHVDVARAIWKKKTAARWAAAAGVKTRIVEYWLARTHPVSADGKVALARQILD